PFLYLLRAALDIHPVPTRKRGQLEPERAVLARAGHTPFDLAGAVFGYRFLHPMQDRIPIADLGKEVLHRRRVGFSVLRPYREADRIAHSFTIPDALIANLSN